jgi:hypothetical protein
MANFYRDNDDLQFVIKNVDWGKFVPMLEDDFKEAAEFEMAPKNLAEAKETYDMILDTVGQVAAEVIAPDAAEVDKIGAKLVDGVVHYAPPTVKHIAQLKELGLMGMTLPRRFGGQNLPETLYTAANELIARADSGLMTIFSLQGCAETINFFASEELKEKYLPPTASGEKLHAMALTEPNSGSDLGSVKTKATAVDEAKGLYKINGSKQFITNGCADIILTLARSEEGSTDARGLSLFIVEKGPLVQVARIEEKCGIHGSPTCVLVYNDAPGYLVGKRKRGLTQYVFQLMFGARLGIAIQAIGIAQGALECAKKYTSERKQFGTILKDFGQIRQILIADEVDLEAARALVYETAVLVDIRVAVERMMEKHPEKADALKPELKKYEKLCDTVTPIAKYVATELVNRIASDAIQVHGGYGFTREYPAERFFRDARITNIYEGTSQIQARAAVPGILSGNIEGYFVELSASVPATGPVGEMRKKADGMRSTLGRTVNFVKEQLKDEESIAIIRRELTDIACDVLQSYYLLRQAAKSARKVIVARKFMHDASFRVKSNSEKIFSRARFEIEDFEKIMDERN